VRGKRTGLGERNREVVMDRSGATHTEFEAEVQRLQTTNFNVI
jgi:hypothetical protein